MMKMYLIVCENYIVFWLCDKLIAIGERHFTKTKFLVTVKHKQMLSNMKQHFLCMHMT